MGRRITNAARLQLRQEASQVRQILHEWGPIPGSPADEYDCLLPIMKKRKKWTCAGLRHFVIISCR
jgi:hypothetical protein